MEDFLGTVISTITSPSPSEMNFVVTSGNVHRGQFVEVDYSEGTIVALITNVIKTNRYFERADSVKEFEARGSALFEQFPTSEWEYLIANTRPLGVFQKGRVLRASFPPSPGTRVRLAKADTLKNFFKFDEEKGMNLGKVEFHDLDVKINMTKLLKKHLAILSISGAGKSYFTSVLFEELLDRKKENGRIACVVLDPHGEYSSFAEPVKDKEHADYSDRTLLVKGRNVRIAVPSLSVGMLAGIITGLSGPQKRDLKKILANLNSEMKSGLGPFDFDGVKKEILKDEEIKENTKGPLLGWISELEQMHLFAKIDSPSARDVVRPGFLTIIDLSDIIDIKKKQVIVSHFANKLFSERRKKSIPPFLLVLEEAHQFVPERVSEEQAVSRSIIRTIAREGRKFGASICLVSQRPVQLDTTALSQCNTKIILRITNPYDLKHIAESAEAIDQRSLEMITSLQVGEALVIGEAVNYPLFFKVRERKSLPSKHEISLEDAAVEFESSKKKSDEETEMFL
ncbi:MAG: ATP-binding protein [Candidatus Diapherotrites archaeon]